MGQTNNITLLTVLKWMSVVVVIYYANLTSSFFSFFSDLGPNEGPFERALISWGIFLFAGMYVGAAVPRFWYLAFLMAATHLLAFEITFHSEGSMPGHNENYWWIVFNLRIVSPLIALFSAYIGSRAHKFIAKRVWLDERKSLHYDYIHVGDSPYEKVNPSPLHIAAAQGNLPEISRHVEKHGDLNDRDMLGRTPLHYAVAKQQVAAVKELLLNGADPDVKEDEYLMTPLHWAIGLGDIDMVRVLVQEVKDINVKNKDGQTAAEIASINRYDKILQILTEYGVMSMESNEHETQR